MPIRETDNETLLRLLGAKTEAEAVSHLTDLRFIATAALWLRDARTRDQWDAAAGTVVEGLVRAPWFAPVPADPWPGEPDLPELLAIAEAAREARSAQAVEELGGALATLWAAVDRWDRVQNGDVAEVIPFPTDR